MSLPKPVRRVYHTVRKRYDAMPRTARPPATSAGLATLVTTDEADLLIRHGAYPPPPNILRRRPRLVTVAQMRRDLPGAVRVLVVQALSERRRCHA